MVQYIKYTVIVRNLALLSPCKVIQIPEFTEEFVAC